MSIVSNATPLIYLAKIDRLDLLRKIFSEVVIPEEVKVEVVDKGKELMEKDAYIVENAINDGWLKVYQTQLTKTPIKLEAGEIATLSLAKSRGIPEVLIDENPARTAAKLLGLTPRGTIFVLLKALEMKEINLNEFIDTLQELITVGFRLKEEVYLEALRKAKKIDER
jgi:predicted nucleic acid-binding protein